MITDLPPGTGLTLRRTTTTTKATAEDSLGSGKPIGENVAFVGMLGTNHRSVHPFIQTFVGHFS